MYLLIDGDLILYRTAFACSKTSEAAAKRALDSTILGIMESLETNEGTIFLTGYGNFRKQVTKDTSGPDYKGNRKDAPRPQHLDSLRSYLLSDYDAVSVNGIEADDAMGILQTISSGNSIIVTTDKDLDTIPGMHYNFTKRKLYNVTPEEAARNLDIQLITGDQADNVRGIKGYGPKKAAKWLDEGKTVGDLYWEQEGEQGLLRLAQNRLLLTILTDYPPPEHLGVDLYQNLRSTLDSSIASLTKYLEENTLEESSTG